QYPQGGTVDVIGLGQIDDNRLEMQCTDDLLDVGIQHGAQGQAHVTKKLEYESTIGFGKLNPASGHHSGFLLNSKTEISSGITFASAMPNSAMSLERSPPACSSCSGRLSSVSFRVVPATQSSTPSEQSVREKRLGSGISWFSYSASSNRPTGRPYPLSLRAVRSIARMSSW